MTSACWSRECLKHPKNSVDEELGTWVGEAVVILSVVVILNCKEASEMCKQCVPSQWFGQTIHSVSLPFPLSRLCWCIWPWHVLVDMGALNTQRQWVRGPHRAPPPAKGGRQEGQLFWLKCTNKSTRLDNHFSRLSPQGIYSSQHYTLNFLEVQQKPIVLSSQSGSPPLFCLRSPAAI